MPACGTGIMWKWQKGGSEEVSGSTSPWTQGLLVPSDTSSGSSLLSPATGPSAAPAAASLSPSSCCENLISTESSCSPVVHPMSLESDQMSSFHLFSCKAVLWEGSSTQPSLGSGTPRSIPRRPGLSELQQGHSCVLSAWTRSHPQCWLLKRHNKITSHEQDVPANHGFAGLSAAT